MQKIDITINNDATIEYKVSGVQGKSCKDVTKFIDLLSDKTLETKNTTEFYQTPQKLQQKLGN